MKILVTGGTGVLGTGVVTELLRRGHSVTLVSRHASSDAKQWPSEVRAINGNVAEPTTIAGVAEGCDLVLHLVGIVQEAAGATFDSVNVGGTRNMISEAQRARVPRFIYVSSLGADVGESSYHRSKAEGERLVRAFRGEWTICRPGNVYGPGDEQISLLLRMVRGMTNVVPKIGDGEQPIQPIWWEDAAVALAEIAERRDLSSRELDLAGAEVTSQNDLIRRLSEITGRAAHGIPVPEFVASLGARAAALIGIDLGLNEDQITMVTEGNVIRPGGINALTDVLGVTPTSLDAGLRALADSQVAQRALRLA